MHARQIAIIVTLAALMAPAVEAQKRPATRAGGAGGAQYKGVWESVSYPADLRFNDVLFVTPDIGWVTGGVNRGGGVLLHTRDGGESWDVQLGDPESREPAFQMLRFLDGTHGWAVQPVGVGKYNLVRTADGDSWEQHGSIETAWGLRDYTFLSRHEGVYLDANNNVSRLMHTANGGRSWQEVFSCRATIVTDGLTRDAQCALKSFHFPTPRVGYAVGGANGAARTLFVAKTVDGGRSWKLTQVADVGGDLESNFEQEVFFTDEQTGVVHLSDRRLYRTTDGGRTWTGVVATPGPEIKFADPEVGWSFVPYRTLSYTTDGGRRWSSRDIAFPAPVIAFSLPRRDRGYVVGEHGMIFRYRVVPASQATPKALAGPVMPLFASALDEQVDEFEELLETLEESVAAADAAEAPGAGDAGRAAASEAAEPESGGRGNGSDTAEPASAFAADCCGKPLSRMKLLLVAMNGTLPQLLGRYRNMNLVLVGQMLLNDLPARRTALLGALDDFRTASDKAAAKEALGRVKAAIADLRQSTAGAYQTVAVSADAGAPMPAGAAVGAAAGETRAAQDSTAKSAADKQKQSDTKNRVKRGLRGLIEKKLPE